MLADASGSVEAKIWSPLSASFPVLRTGGFFYARGRVSTFRDQLQFTVEEGRLLTPEEGAALDLADFMPASPYPLDAMMDELMALVREEFRHKPWRRLVDGVFKNEALREAFRTCPAAKGVHHAYAGGLLEHTLGVFKLCRRLADQYPELDRQTLLAGALFHDFGKIREFSGGIANDYTDEGRLLGHLEICVPGPVRPAGRRRELDALSGHSGPGHAPLRADAGGRKSRKEVPRFPEKSRG